MSAVSLTYPIAPTNVNPRILEPSADFRREAIRVLAAILFFIAVYIVLIAAAIALAALCVAGGLFLIAAKPMLITIMLGVGLAGLGVMVVFFLLKFLFKTNKVDRSQLIEITKDDQPHLFEFIKMLAKETQTPLPRRIYVSPEVNASVFYDSSVWSMVLPVRKNLMIGLGLVNSVTLSEFKAVIAHEFGHFSQRSMKLGSYVYNTNRIIFNLLYDNEGYGNALEKWGNASGYFAVFANLTVRIVQGIQWIMQKVYAVVNRPYMSLSRQMEFHADSVAASVAGGNHLISSLRRLEVADTTYNAVFSFYQNHFNESLKPDNVYPQHKEVMQFFAGLHGLPLEHDLPQVNGSSFARFNRSRITIKDQWASHPSTDDREAHLRSLNIETPSHNTSAWLLFDQPIKLQKQITGDIFDQVQYKNPVQLVDESAFRQRYREMIRRYQLPEAYKGYYDGRDINPTDLRNLESIALAEATTLDKILTEEVVALPYRRNGIANDLEMVKAILDGNMVVKHFDFDGKKYDAEESYSLRSQLEVELKETEAKLAESDRNLIAWFLRKTGSQLENLRQLYGDYFLLCATTKTDIDVCEAVRFKLMPLYQTMELEFIPKAVDRLKTDEKEFKNRLERLISDPLNDRFINVEDRKTVTEYLSKDLDYFKRDNYIYQSLEMLNTCMSIYYQICNERLFTGKLGLLGMQLEWVREGQPPQA